MCDEEKKNSFPRPSREAVKISYILFVILLILLLGFCVMFLSAA